MILLDTSAVYAMANASDPHYSEAEALFRRLSEQGEELLLHSYVRAEAASRIQRRLGLQPALRFLRESRAFHLHWISEAEHEAGVELLEQERRRDLSLVHCVSFVVMRALGLDTAFAFNANFERAGFHLYNGGA